MTLSAVVLHADERMLAMIESLLGSAGFAVASTRDPFALLRGDPDSAPDLVLLGLAAVDERDLELVTLLRNRHPRTLILVTFPASLRDRAAAALDLGADAFLPEPFYPAELLALARRAGIRAAADPGPIAVEPGADDDIEQLAAGVAHSVNQPLQILALLLDNAETGDDPDHPEMRRQLRRIAETVEGLTRFSGRQHVSRVPVDLNSLVREAFRPDRTRDAPEIVLSLTREPTGVLAQADSLGTAFSILRTRAERVTPSRGKISVSTRTRSQRGHRFVQLTVTDGGPPLDPARMAQLFVPRIDTDSLQDGTWLELAAFAGIVRSHDGSASAEAREGGGTMIHVLLPADDPGSTPGRPLL